MNPTVKKVLIGVAVVILITGIVILLISYLHRRNEQA